MKKEGKKWAKGKYSSTSAGSMRRLLTTGVTVSFPVSTISNTMKWVVWFYSDRWWKWMKSEEYTELQTLQKTTAILCQLKRLWHQFTLIQCWWKWVQRLLEDHKWLSSEVFEQVKLEIDSTRINQSNCSNENIAKWRREVMLQACISVTSD